MILNARQLNPHSCLTYLLTQDGSSNAVIIDPVLEHVKDYADLLDQEKLTLTHVIDTHTHADHISGGPALKDITDCRYLMHKNAPAKCAEGVLDDGVSLELFDGVEVKVMSSPGHTGDSISLIFPDRVYTGDALFLDDGGAGRDDLPGGDSGAHWDTLERMKQLSDDLVIYPAHDYRKRQPTSLARQKETNPHLKDRSREEFVSYLDGLKLGPADWMKDVLKANYACARDPRAAWIPVDQPACEIKGTAEKNVNELEVTAVTAPELENMMQSVKPPFLLDVREVKELSDQLGHIEGVMNIPVWILPHRLSDLDDKKNNEIIIVCRSGSRAFSAAQILQKAGFPHVNVLYGGMIEWNRYLSTK